MPSPTDSFTFTVGKLDAGMAILIGERAHLIEFPSLLLPPGVTSGSIVNIAVHRNTTEERRQKAEFWELQDQISATFGVKTPVAPKLELRNVTQTSVTLEWPSLDLATSKLRSLDMYKNGQRLAAIPAPLSNTSTKLSGLDLQTDYTFQLVLRTTAGTYPSNVLKVKTHSISDTSGISVCFGNVQDSVLLETAKLALSEMKAKWSDRIQIDTTHFVCTTPAATPSGASVAGNTSSNPGVEYQKALQLSIPVVQPQWVLACLREKKMVPISSFYLGANVNNAISPSAFSRLSRAPTLPSSPPAAQPESPTTPQNPSAESRARSSNDTTSSAPNGVASPPTSPTSSRVQPTRSDSGSSGRPRNGTMNKSFKFPPEPSLPSPPVPPLPNTVAEEKEVDEERTVDIPPPTPVAKERPSLSHGDSSRSLAETDDEVGETVEVDLS